MSKKEKLVICKKCKNIYNRKIKRCPNCHSVNKRMLFTKIFQLIVTLMLMVSLKTIYDIEFGNNDLKININDQIKQTEDIKSSVQNDESYKGDEYTDFVSDDNTTISSTVQIDRSNSKAEEAELSTGQYVVGETIQPGRYICTSIDTPAVVTIYDNIGQQTFYELVGKTEEGYGTQTLTVDLMEGYVVEIPNGTIALLPVETNFMEIISTGNWYVGLDIEPGLYDIKCNAGDGSIILVDGENNIISIMNSVKTDFSTQIELKEGQQLRIYTIDELELIPIQ